MNQGYIDQLSMKNKELSIARQIVQALDNERFTITMLCDHLYPEGDSALQDQQGMWARCGICDRLEQYSAEVIAANYEKRTAADTHSAVGGEEHGT